MNYFISQSGINLFEQQWTVDDPKGAIILVHGMGEHCGRYAHVAAYLNRHRYSLYAYDHEGHGKSDGVRVYIDSFDIFSRDLLQFVRRVRQAVGPKLPLFAYGHSMGGGIVAYTAVTDLLPVQGIVLSSAALKMGKSIPPFLISLAQGMGRYAPKVRFSGLDVRMISRDPAVVARYQTDPLVHHGGITARLGAEMLRGMKVIAQRAEQIDHPILLWHGTKDRLTEIEGTLQLHARVGSTDKTLKIYEGLSHECHNEPEQAQVLADLVMWLDQQVATTTVGLTHHQRRAKQRAEQPINQ